MSAIESSGKGAVFLTGASGGIGLATSRLLREHGFRIFGTHLPSEDPSKLAEIGVVPVEMEITDPASVRAARERVEAQLGDALLSGLINNAGTAEGGPIEMLDLDAVRKQLEVNVFGMFAVTHTFLPLIRAAKGRIVNISSVSGRLAVPFLAPYCASKFAVEAFSDSLRREMYPFGVGVVIIQPAQTRTPIWDRAAQTDLARFRGTPYEKVAEKMKKRLTKGTTKGLDPARVAGAVLRALTEPNPPTRIPVLKKKTKYVLAGLLPDRIIDRMVARQIWE